MNKIVLLLILVVLIQGIQLRKHEQDHKKCGCGGLTDTGKNCDCEKNQIVESHRSGDDRTVIGITKKEQSMLKKNIQRSFKK
ncbi:hypothetical protein pb186bvf_018180 [Paramecium bursaria]